MENNKKFIPNKIYREIMANVPICTVDVIFLNKTKEKILLFKRNNEPAKGIYFTIGGRWHKGESLIECAMRQAKSELGISIDPKKTVFAGIIEEHWDISEFGVPYDNIDIFYSYILENEKVNIRFDNQHGDYKWFEVYDPNLHPNIKERIKQILKV